MPARSTRSLQTTRLAPVGDQDIDELNARPVERHRQDREARHEPPLDSEPTHLSWRMAPLLSMRARPRSQFRPSAGRERRWPGHDPGPIRAPQPAPPGRFQVASMFPPRWVSFHPLDETTGGVPDGERSWTMNGNRRLVRAIAAAANNCRARTSAGKDSACAGCGTSGRSCHSFSHLTMQPHYTGI